MPDISKVMTDRGDPTRAREARFTEVFTECYGSVLAFARRRLDESLAQDVVAETFLIAWRRFDELRTDPLPWLYRIASNVVANQRRADARRDRLDARARLERATTSIDPSQSLTESASLAAAFASLTDQDREVLRLAHWEGLGAAAGGTVLGCAPSTFKVRLHRARRRFAKALTDESRSDLSVAGLSQPHPTKETS
jgi:RNA polymerase sigma factor (sigma-70 family)